MVEPIARFTEPLKGTKGVRNIFNVGLEDWQPIEGTKYDLIWTQWCLGHLTDEQVVKYLEVCKSHLTAGTGWIIVKENLSTGLDDMFDATDSSITRYAPVHATAVKTRLTQTLQTRREIPSTVCAGKPAAGTDRSTACQPSAVIATTSPGAHVRPEAAMSTLHMFPVFCGKRV